MPEVIAITNQKGGVGKTTSATNIAASLAIHHNKKVIAFDLDQQGNLSKGLGVEIVKGHTVLEALLRITDHTPYPYQENFHIIPADNTFSTFALNIAHSQFEDLVSEVGKENLLKDYIKNNCAEYDYVILDCPPAMDDVTINAMVAANKVLVPLQAHSFSLQGLQTVLSMMTRIVKRLNTDLDLGGVFFVQHQERKIISRDTADKVKDVAQGKVFTTYIRTSVSLAESSDESVCLDVFTYDKQLEQKSNGATDYQNLTNEFLGKQFQESIYQRKESSSNGADKKELDQEPTEIAIADTELADKFDRFLKTKKP